MDLEKLQLDYEESLVDYECALRTVLAELENVRARMQREYDWPIIANIESRIKTFDSVVEKCRRKNYENSPKKKIEFDIGTIRVYMQDVVGIRIITDYPDDIYRVYKTIRKATNLAITHVDDYIENPKTTGYWGLHLVIQVPVHTEDGTELIMVEVQIRDKNIDLWASIDHFVRYKKKHPPEEAEETLLKMADILREFGTMSVELRNQILATKDEDTEDKSTTPNSSNESNTKKPAI